MHRFMNGRIEKLWPLFCRGAHFRCHAILPQQRHLRNWIVLIGLILISTVFLRSLNGRAPHPSVERKRWGEEADSTNLNTEEGNWDKTEKLIPLSGETKCDDELMAFPVFLNQSFVQFGTTFSCELLQYLGPFGLRTKDYYKTVTNFKDEEVVFVTYASMNHFLELRKAIYDIRKNNFSNKIIFYNLGVGPDEIKELRSVCNLEVRKFDFSRYPQHVKNLFGYHFKPIIIAEIFRDFRAFWIIDTSARFFNRSSWHDFNERVRSGAVEPFVQRHPSGHSIYATTNPGMYKYFPLNASLAKNHSMFDANTMFVVRSNFAKEAVKWNLLCALTKSCMAPPNAQLSCHFGSDRFGVYVNCHRYDQSSINLIVSSLKQRMAIAYQGHKDGHIRDSFSTFSTVRRLELMNLKLNNLSC